MKNLNNQFVFSSGRLVLLDYFEMKGGGVVWIFRFSPIQMTDIYGWCIGEINYYIYGSYKARVQGWATISRMSSFQIILNLYLREEAASNSWNVTTIITCKSNIKDILIFIKLTFLSLNVLTIITYKSNINYILRISNNQYFPFLFKSSVDLKLNNNWNLN